jgi:D-3-phosphoglycerate dehydrogenase
MRGAPVFNAPGANANAVKELVLTALLLAARNIIPAIGYVASLDNSAPDLDERVESGKKQFAGVELPGRTLGIVGLGAIGSLVADTAIKLGMNVVGFDPEITVDAAWRLPSSVRKAHSIEEVLKQSDFVTLHVPLLDVTRHLVSAERLAIMKPGASLLNFARDASLTRPLSSPRCAHAGSSTTCAIFLARTCCANPTWSCCRISAHRRKRRSRTARSLPSTSCARSWRTERSPTP